METDLKFGRQDDHSKTSPTDYLTSNSF